MTCVGKKTKTNFKNIKQEKKDEIKLNIILSNKTMLQKKHKYHTYKKIKSTIKQINQTIPLNQHQSKYIVVI